MLKKIILLILLATGTFAVSAQVTGTPFIWQAKKTDLVVGAASRTGYCAQKYTDLLVSIINNGGRNSKGTFSFTISQVVTSPATENIQFGVADPTAAMSNGDVVNNSDFTFTPTYDATNTYITSYLVTSKPGVIVSAYNYILIALPIKSITASSSTSTILTATIPNGSGGDAVFTNNTQESGINYGSCVPIKANNDNYTIAAGSNSSPANILDNDTFNGAAATLSNVTITQLSTTNPGVTIDPATGLVSVATGTPGGTYYINYTITDQLDPNNASTATVTVFVPNPPVPDMTGQASSNFSSYAPFARPAVFNFNVKNVGAVVSSGLITLTVTISGEPAFQINVTVPPGWTQSQSGNVFTFTTTNSFTAGGVGETISISYNSNGSTNPNGTNIITATGVITTGSGGETNGLNNTASIGVTRGSL